MMIRIPWVVIVAAATTVALILTWTAVGGWHPTPEQGSEEPQETTLIEEGESPTHPIALGVYVEGAPEDPARLDAFAEMVGTQPSIVMWYQDWHTVGVKEFDAARMEEVLERGAMPIVTWEPADYTQRGDQPQYELKTITAGDHDEYIRGWARAAATWGEPFYLRFAHEMNGDWYPWSPLANGNESPAEYVAAWKHVYGVFQAEGATNVRWVWSPDVISPDRPSYESLYPGDEYVDWVAIDAYNWGTSQSWSKWQTFPELFEASYNEMDALHDKPLMVGETAAPESGGDKAAWIRQTFLNDIPSRYPQVRAVIWFHSDKEADWRVNSSENSLQAYREVAASRLYQGQLPRSGQPD